MEVDCACSLGQELKNCPKKESAGVSKVNFLAELKAKQVAKAIIPQSPENIEQEEKDPSSYEKRKVSPRAQNCSARNRSKYNLVKTNSESKLNHRNQSQESENQDVDVQARIEENVDVIQDVEKRVLPGRNNDAKREEYWFCVIC